MTAPSVVAAAELTAPTVVLSLAGTSVERGVVDEFARDLAVAHDPDEAVALASATGGPIAPVGVAWLPPERGDGRRFSVRDLRLLSDPSHPGERAQARLLAKAPERCRVVVGEPAAVDELRERWERHSGDAENTEGFAKFVARQARLAVDRAERGLLGARYKTAHDIVEDLLASRGFREGAAQLGDTEAVIDEAREYLTELASVQNRFARDIWAQGSKLLWGRAYDLDVDTEALERIRALNERYPLVFLPSHKSNMDGFVMSSVTYEYGFPANHIVGGINMGFWPLGALGRRVGVVWIRRSFGGNDVYKYTLRRYLAHLASKRFNLEWYIEGGRSRTGKLLPPKMGLLNYLAKGVDEAGVEEVMLVPVSVTYDHLNELAETTSQVRGVKKRPEGTRWLLRYARSQSGDLGRVRVRFGEPVPLRESLADGDPNALSKVAFEVCTRINRATPVTPISLATFALLGTDGRAVTLAEARAVIEPVREYVVRRGLPGSEGLDNHVEGTLGILVEHGVVERFDGGAEPVFRIRADRDLEAAFYRNVVIHWFVNRAIAEIALSTSEDLEEALQYAFGLRDLLKFEFFFARKREFRDELQAEHALLDTGGRFADRVLRSFLEAYWVVADRLVARGNAPVKPDEIVKECLGVGRQYHLQGQIKSAEAVSSELFKTGLKLAANRGLIEDGSGRVAFKAELEDVLRRL
jgi:glycerol-3-phosphate O-acyltransferase